MVTAKDTRSRAKQGRMFPIPFSVVVRRCRELNLCRDPGVRVNIHFMNARQSARQAVELALARLFPRDELVIYSVPDDLDRDRTREALEQALQRLTGLNKGLRASERNCSDNSSDAYLACLVNGTELKLYHVACHYRRRKYRGTSKFSNAFKSKLVRTVYTELK